MKVLINKEGLGSYFTDLKPISEDILVYKDTEEEYRFIHEKCFHDLCRGKTNPNLLFYGYEYSCRICAKDIPKNLVNFIDMTNSLNKLEGDRDGEQES